MAYKSDGSYSFTIGQRRLIYTIHPHFGFSIRSISTPRSLFVNQQFVAAMASLTVAFSPAVFAATAAKGGGGSKEEKGILDWILGGLQKEDQLLETDPILKKVEEKNGGSNNGGRKNSVAVPQKKGGFGGLFSKN